MSYRFDSGFNKVLLVWQIKLRKFGVHLFAHHFHGDLLEIGLVQNLFHIDLDLIVLKTHTNYLQLKKLKLNIAITDGGVGFAFLDSGSSSDSSSFSSSSSGSSSSSSSDDLRFLVFPEDAGAGLFALPAAAADDGGRPLGLAGVVAFDLSFAATALLFFLSVFAFLSFFWKILEN